MQSTTTSSIIIMQHTFISSKDIALTYVSLNSYHVESFAFFANAVSKIEYTEWQGDVSIISRILQDP